MSIASEERKEQIEKLENFIVHTRTKISSIVSALGWSIESLTENAENIVACPFNETHRIPEKSVEKHLEDCQWKAEGYNKNDLPLSIPTLPPEAASCIKFDEQLQDSVIQNAKCQNPAMIVGSGGRLIPRTSDRLVADFTREERCAMYEYVIANTVQPDIGEDIADMNKPKTPGDGARSSYVELLAQERNLKRRRAKYRGVHTNKKSQVEILREIISQQMEMLGEYIAEKNDDEPSRWSTNSLPSEDTTRDRSREIRNHDNSMKKNYSLPDKNLSMPDGDINGKSWDKKKSENRNVHSSLSNNREYDRKNNVSRDHDRRKHESRERREYSRDRSRENSRRERSHKSSHRRHKHKSKDRHDERHKRHRSRDREKSRSSKESKYEERRTKKRRKSRD